MRTFLASKLQIIPIHEHFFPTDQNEDYHSPLKLNIPKQFWHSLSLLLPLPLQHFLTARVYSSLLPRALSHSLALTICRFIDDSRTPSSLSLSSPRSSSLNCIKSTRKIVLWSQTKRRHKQQPSSLRSGRVEDCSLFPLSLTMCFAFRSQTQKIYQQFCLCHSITIFDLERVECVLGSFGGWWSEA